MIASAGHHFCRCPGTVKCSHTVCRGARDIKIPGHIGVGSRYLDMRALVLLLPRLFEVAQPELNVANDVDSFAMLDESVRRRVHAHGLDAGVAVERIGAVANLFTHRVLEEPMDEDHIASGKL